MRSCSTLRALWACIALWTLRSCGSVCSCRSLSSVSPCRSCIALRTVVLKDGKAFVQAGAGVVADSVPANEYLETVNKARGMMRAIARAKQLSEERGND